MQIAWSQRTLQEENSLGRVSRSRPDLVISQAVVPFTNAGPRVAVPFQRHTAVHQPSHLILAGRGSGR
eukprot:scaffold81529_cov61-Phaeocystis_antarctica.AAC.2